MRKTSILRLLLLSTAMPLAGVGLAAHAQTATGSAAGTPSGKLQEITVTAERKTENLQKAAVAVTVISGQKIQAQGESTLEEIVRDVPGVNITMQPNGANANIRGEGADLPPGSAQGAVAMEFDGVYTILYEAGVVGYYDVSRVEVLPGPQGTLYGVNADGGVINVISNDPVLGKFSATATENIGNFGRFREEAAVNIPVTDQVAVRVAGAAINQGSFYTPGSYTTGGKTYPTYAVGNNVAQTGRIKILYQPNDDLTAKLTYNFLHIGGQGSASGQVAPYVGGTINNIGNPWVDTGQVVSSGPSSANSEEHLYDNSVNLNVAYKIGNLATLTLAPSAERIHAWEQNCGANGPPGAIGSGSCSPSFPYKPFYQYSGEARLNSVATTPLQWDVGLYHWNYDQVQTNFNGSSAQREQAQGAASNAAFGEVTYSVRPDFRLIGGIRQTIGDHFNTNGTTYQIQVQDSHHFDYRAGIEYDLTPSSMEYFTASTGYRPGGYNTLPGGSLQVYKNEEITSFEAGSKNRFFDNTLQVNADVFYMIQKNYQLFDLYFLPFCFGPAGQGNPACGAPTINLQGHNMGLEFQTRYNVTPDDQISFSGSAMDATFDKNQPGPCIAPVVAESAGIANPGNTCYVGYNAPITSIVTAEQVAGEEQPHAPPFSANLSYNHTWTLANAATVTGGVQLFYSTRFYVHPIENTYAVQPWYWTQGLNVSYAPANGVWTANAYVHNLSNYAVKDSSTPFTSLGEPRTFGVTATYHW